MPPLVALAACAILVVLLLAVERKDNGAVSGALWVPTCWMLIAGSRPLGRWLGTEAESAIEGSFWDRNVLSLLILSALVICVKRRVIWLQILRENVWVVVLFFYMAISILWSDFPHVSLKRWIRSAGPVVMAAMVLTEERPIQAVCSILRRVAYVLIPVSVVLIKYFPQFGRGYGRWTGAELWTGVATNKNSLGQLCAVSAVFLVWSFISKRAETTGSKHRWCVRADITVLLVAVFLLIGPGAGAYSATSIVVAVLGIVLCVTLQHLPTLARAATAKAELLVGGLVLTYVGIGNVVRALVAQALARRDDLTGRATDIWPEVLAEAAKHPILGTGYGGAWYLGGNLSSLTRVEEAHNGYLDVFLQVGLVGILLIGAFLLSICGKIRREACRDLQWASFALSLLLMTLVYNLTESAFFDFYLPAVLVLVVMATGAGMEQTNTRRLPVARLDIHRDTPSRPLRLATPRHRSPAVGCRPTLGERLAPHGRGTVVEGTSEQSAASSRRRTTLRRRRM